MNNTKIKNFYIVKGGFQIPVLHRRTFEHQRRVPIMPPGTGDAAGDSSSRGEIIRNGLAVTPGNVTNTANPNPTTPSNSGKAYPEIENLYEIHKTIGNGGFSKVKMATELSTGNKVAIKIVDKIHVGAELPRIALEIETLQPLCHIHICKLMKVFYTEKKIFMVMEYCPMDLYEYIVRQDDYLSEDEARRIFVQLLSAVDYLHMNGIAHRDLKPENILLDYDNNVKLTDFGLCAVPKKRGINKAILRTMCGSPAYCAPELLKNLPYVGSKVDVWSLGVILFVLLTGQLPFYSKNLRDLYRKIQQLQYTTPTWLTEGSKDIISRMLQANMNNRPSLNKLWVHPWIKAAGNVLDNFQDQIILAEKEMAEVALNEFGDSAPRRVVGYMMSRISIASSSNRSQNVEGSQISVDGDVETEENSFSHRNKCIKSILKTFYRVQICLGKAWRYFNKKSELINNEADKEPLEVDLETLRLDKNAMGLTIVDEEFADCILDKLQISLQSMGIHSERKGSSVKHGTTSPCKFKFEVVSLEPWNLFCIRRKYISAQDPKIICNIMQRVLLISRGTAIPT